MGHLRTVCSNIQMHMSNICLIVASDSPHSMLLSLRCSVCMPFTLCAQSTFSFQLARGSKSAVMYDAPCRATRTVTALKPATTAQDPLPLLHPDFLVAEDGGFFGILVILIAWRLRPSGLCSMHLDPQPSSVSCNPPVVTFERRVFSQISPARMTISSIH